VTKIGGFAFSGCTSLTSIELPDSLTEIDLEAFEGCTALTSIRIPGTVNSVRENAFGDCSSLTEIHLEHQKPDTILGDRTSLDPTRITLFVPKGSEESYRRDPSFSRFKEIKAEK